LTSVFRSNVPVVRNAPANKAQTPLVRLVVFMLYNNLYNISTTNPQEIESPQQIHNILLHVKMLWIRCGLYSKSTTSPQQIELVEFGFRQVVDLSWRCSQSQRAVVSRDDYDYD